MQFQKPVSKMKRIASILLLFIVLLMVGCALVKRTDSPATCDETTAKALATWRSDHFGLFIHFGVYSHLEGVWKGERIPYYGEQIMNHARIPVSEYEAVAREFNPTDFDADAIVSLAKEAGMKYIVITTKHHDGFCLFDTKTTDYDMVDYTPYHQDVVRLLADACHRQGMKLGFYYSLPDWHFPKGLPRLAPDPNSKCNEYVNQVYSPLEALTPELEDYAIAQVTELLTHYGEITTMWFDMGLVTPEFSKRLRNTVKKLQPQCLINGRIMNNMGDYMTLPDNGDVASYGDVFWDNPASLYGTWGYKNWIKRPAVDVQVATQIERLTSTVSHGGVFLLNIGPDKKGRVIDYEQQVLRGIGDFLRAHPDTLNILEKQSHNAPKYHYVKASDEIILTPENGLWHAQLDGTGYMSVEPHSWMDWYVQSVEETEYDVFIVYKPEHNDKCYTITVGPKSFRLVLPGVDRMKQTAYVGSCKAVDFKGYLNVSIKQTNPSNILDPLGLELCQLILRRK